MMRPIIAMMCTVLATSGIGGAEKEAGTAADRTAVGKLATDWAAAWSRHDPEGMASAFSERGDLINPMGAVAKGRPQVLELFQREHAGRLKQSTLALNCEPARFFDASVAEVDCDRTGKGMTGPQAPPSCMYT